ncbi:hypothetical protein Aduo_013207 [Ancylostoma duodenale]
MSPEMLKKLIDLAPTLIPIIIAYFEVIGLFGNINLIVATIRRKHLRTKHGVLLALTTFYQTLCLLGELANFGSALYDGPHKQNLCFLVMTPYIFFCCMQSTMFLVLSLDTLFSVLCPLKHMVARLWIYVSIASIPPVLYAALIISLNVEELFFGDSVNNTVIICNPPLSMDPKIASFWVNWNGFSNLGVLCIHFTIYLIVTKKEKKQLQLGRVVKDSSDKHDKKQDRNPPPMRKTLSVSSISAQVKKAVERKRVLISLMWLVAIFTSTWCTCMLSQVIVSWMPPSDITIVVETYAVIFALMAYSVNYYVYFARNQTYRKVFLEQLGCLLPERFRNGNVWNHTQSYGSMHTLAGHSTVHTLPSLRHQSKYGTTRQSSNRIEPRGF